MRQPPILFPDAVLVLIEYLRPRMVGVVVDSRVPDPRPDRFIRVKRVGGTRRDIVHDRPRLDVHFWAETEEGAEALMARGRALIHAMSGRQGDTTVSRIREIGGPQWLPDDVSGQPRYALAFELSLRGRALEP